MNEKWRAPGAVDVFDLDLNDISVDAGTSIAFDVLGEDGSRQGLAVDTISEYTRLTTDEARRVIGAVATSLNEIQMLTPQDFVDGPPQPVKPEQSPQLAALDAVQQDDPPYLVRDALQSEYGLNPDVSDAIASQAAQDINDLESLTYAQEY